MPKNISNRKKGKSIIAFPNDYVLLDIETTGLSTEVDHILEIGALKIRNNTIVDKFHSFVEYNGEIPLFVTALTGITSEILIGAPHPTEAITEFLEFLGNDIMLGYNINFDVNFLYDYSEKYVGKLLQNDFVDCMRFARKLYPNEKHHRLKDMATLFNLSLEYSHRALGDCLITKEVYDNLYCEMIKQYNDEISFANKYYKKNNYKFNGKNNYKLNANDITTINTIFDETHLLFGKNCVFTGTLEKMLRKDAMQIVVDLGGKVQNNITQTTNFLILGNNDYCSSIKDGKSSKQKKAELLMEQGKDITIMPENVFYDLVFSSNLQGNLENTYKQVSTLQEISSEIQCLFNNLVLECKCIEEDLPDFIRLHIYTSGNRKAATVKIIKSDLSIQLRKFTNGMPISVSIKSVEEINEYF